MIPLYRIGGVILLISTFTSAQYDQYKAVDKDPSTFESEKTADGDTNLADDKEKRPFGGIFGKPYDIGKRPFGSIFSSDYGIGKRPFGGSYTNSFKIGKRPFGRSYGNSFSIGKRPFGSFYGKSYKIGKRPFGGTYKSWFKMGKRPFGGSYRGSFKVGKRPFSTYGGSFGIGKRPFGTYGGSFDVGKRAIRDDVVVIGEDSNEHINPGPGFTFDNIPDSAYDPEFAQILTSDKPYISLDDLADVIILETEDNDDDDDDDDEHDDVIKGDDVGDDENLLLQKKPFTLGGGPFSLGKRSAPGPSIEKRPFTFWYPYKLGKRLSSRGYYSGSRWKSLLEKRPFVLGNFGKRPLMSTMNRFNIGKRASDQNDEFRKKRPFTSSNGFGIGKRPFVLGGFDKIGKRPFFLGSFNVGKRPFVLGGFQTGSFGKRNADGSKDEMHADNPDSKRPFGGTYGGSYMMGR